MLTKKTQTSTKKVPMTTKKIPILTKEEQLTLINNALLSLKEAVSKLESDGGNQLSICQTKLNAVLIIIKGYEQIINDAVAKLELAGRSKGALIVKGELDNFKKIIAELKLGS